MLSSQSVFTTAQVSEITRALDKKVSEASGAASAGASSGQSSQQVHEYLKDYFTDYIWGIIMSHTSVQSKLEHLSHFFVQSIGLRHPSEKTRRDAVAIILAATNTDCSGVETLNHIQDLRRLMESARLVCAHGFKGPDRYPADVITFRSMFPESYKDCVPVPSQISEESFRSKQSGTPCRQSHASVGDGKTYRYHGKKPVHSVNAHATQSEPTDSDMKSQMLSWIMNNNQPSSSSIPQFQSFLDRSMKVEPKIEPQPKIEQAPHGGAGSSGVYCCLCK